MRLAAAARLCLEDSTLAKTCTAYHRRESGVASRLRATSKRGIETRNPRNRYNRHTDADHAPTPGKMLLDCLHRLQPKKKKNPCVVSPPGAPEIAAPPRRQGTRAPDQAKTGSRHAGKHRREQTWRPLDTRKNSICGTPSALLLTRATRFARRRERGGKNRSLGHLPISKGLAGAPAEGAFDPTRRRRGTITIAIQDK